VLATFGGAGGQHACAVADALAVETVLIHPLAGVLSAYGMGLADLTAMREQAVEAPLTDNLLPAMATTADNLEADARAELADGGADPAQVTSVRRAHLRYAGTDTALPVPLSQAQDMVAAFEHGYRQQFSFLMPDKTILVEAVSVETVLPGGAQRSPGDTPGPPMARNPPGPRPPPHSPFTRLAGKPAGPITRPTRPRSHGFR
jgi:5-oxoprolinase (ATP-hydrolysing)